MIDKTTAKENLKFMGRIFTRNENMPIFIVFIVLIIVIEIIQPKFLSAMNIRNVLIQVSITGIAAIGMTFVMISGGIDLSIAWMISFLGCFMAYLMVVANLPIFLIVIICVITAIAGSSLMSFIISRTKLEPFIVSLGFMSIYQGLTYIISKGSERGIGDKFMFLGNTFPLTIGMPVYIFVILAIIFGLVLQYTKLGKRIFAVGGNEEAAYLVGIKIKNFKMLVYMLNGLLISIAAMTQLSRLHSGIPLMGSGKELDAIAAVAVGGTALSGGKGSIIGTVFGVLLLGIIANGMNIMGVNPYWQYVFKGVVIIVSVWFSYYSGLKASNINLKNLKKG